MPVLVPIFGFFVLESFKVNQSFQVLLCIRNPINSVPLSSHSATDSVIISPAVGRGSLKMEEASFFQLPPSLQPFGHQTNVFEDRSWQGSGKALVKHGTLLQHDLEDLYGKSRGDEEEVQEKHTNSYLESNERVMRKVLRGEGNMADIENTEKYLDSSDVHKFIKYHPN